jgi:hypothetical protein
MTVRPYSYTNNDFLTIDKGSFSSCFCCCSNFDDGNTNIYINKKGVVKEFSSFRELFLTEEEAITTNLLIRDRISKLVYEHFLNFYCQHEDINPKNINSNLNVNNKAAIKKMCDRAFSYLRYTFRSFKKDTENVQLYEILRINKAISAIENEYTSQKKTKIFSKQRTQVKLNISILPTINTPVPTAVQAPLSNQPSLPSIPESEDEKINKS